MLESGYSIQGEKFMKALTVFYCQKSCAVFS